MLKIPNILTKLPRHLLILLSLGLVVILGIIDYLTSPQFSFAIFYVMPVALVAWYVNYQTGVIFSLICTISWFAANTPGQAFSDRHGLVFGWNAVTRFGFFFIVTWILSTLKNALDHEKDLARTDPLTGAANTRAFFEFANLEIQRVRRYNHPLTVMYIDADNFKTVNDRWGHNIGDTALRVIAETIRHHLRINDVTARLGGDEFAVILPETDPEAAQTTGRKIQQYLLEQMQAHEWPITFSIGILTYCDRFPSTVQEMVNTVDQIMYMVKNSGKNAIKHEILCLSSSMTT